MKLLSSIRFYCGNGVLVFGVAMLLGSAGSVSAGEIGAASVDSEAFQLEIVPSVPYEDAVLTISGPGAFVIRREYQADEPIFLRAISGEESLPDGTYRYELLSTPKLSNEVRASLAAARENGTAEKIVTELKDRGVLASERSAVEGTFSIVDGVIVVPRGETGETTKDGDEQTKDILHYDDVIITGSLCVGFDCQNGEAFGYDTIILKEHNLRIYFNDTSYTASYPTNNWRITVNSSTNGGGSYFSIDDVDDGTAPFRIEAGAPSYSLYVEDYGRVGIGTSTPVVELHVKDGDTPTLRLEQDGSSGFTPQTWDLAGNETNFFVRDATNGSKLPFRIQPGTPSSALTLKSDGKVGIGTWSPATSFEIERTGEHAELTLDVTDAKTWSFRSNSPTGKFVVTNVSDTRSPFKIDSGAITNTLTMDATGVGILTNSPAGALDVNGSIFQRGSSLHADYVFEPNYELESIDEHSKFMWQHRHLPAIPGAGSGDSGGQQVVEIGAHRRGIVEELEKAHIYIEQLHGLIGELRHQNHAKIDALEQRLDQLEGEKY